MSSGGRSAAISTITMVTRPADGMLAAPMLASVAVRLQEYIRHVKLCHQGQGHQRVSSHLIVTTSPAAKFLPLSCAMKIAATASYKAVPSMFTVAPTGNTNRVTLLSM